MRKRIIHVLNWDKYQARSDKELPWCKLWGRLFKAPWFITLKDDEKFCTIAILDMARQFNNKLTEEMLFKGDLNGNNPYLKQIYGVFMTKEKLSNLCNYLSDNEFLSDNIVGLEGDKIRQDKIRVEIETYQPLKDASKEKIPKDLETVKSYFSEIGSFLEAPAFFDYFSANGWKVGGKTPMVDWRAAARGWVRRSKTFNTKEQKHESGIDRINRIAAEARRKALPVNP